MQLLVDLSHRFPRTSDNKCGKYGWKVTYTPSANYAVLATIFVDTPLLPNFVRIGRNF